MLAVLVAVTAALYAGKNNSDWDLLYVGGGLILFVAVVAAAAALVPRRERHGEAPAGSPDIAAHERRRA
ncbi:MAG TPA: hypothetical protein VKU91_01025 [Acidimicrobiales bacterium]|nr:hypothetical protein [Acidimicrobiales bacterium]